MVCPEVVNNPTQPVTILPLGALVQSFQVGKHNIVQGFKTPEQYRAHNAPYFGETVGRVANRISNARINNLNGKSYSLAANNGPNALHGGPKGWGKQEFRFVGNVQRHGREAAQYVYLSQDGDEGYPGQVECRVWYTQWHDRTTRIQTECERTNLGIEYEIQFVGDDTSIDETIVSVTNHSYFNITAGPTIAGTEVVLATKQHQVIDSALLPTGKIGTFDGTATDEPFVLGDKSPIFDHCFVINTDPASVPLDSRSRDLSLLLHASCPETGIHLEALSTEPAFQFYTGEYVDVPAVDDLPPRPPRAGFCVEPSRYINAANTEEWQHMVRLKRGQTWGSRLVYRAWIEGEGN